METKDTVTLVNTAYNLTDLRSEYLRLFNSAVELAINYIEKECLQLGIASPQLAPKEWEIIYTSLENGKRSTKIIHKESKRIFVEIYDSLHEIAVVTYKVG